MMMKKRKSITTTAKRKSRTRSQSVVLLEPRKAIKPPRRRSGGGGGGGNATATITRTTASSSSRGKAKHPRLSSALSKANRIGRVRDVSYFERLPSDVIGRILFSGYFDSVTVLTRHALVDKKIRSLAEVYYASLDLHKLNIKDDDLIGLLRRFKNLRTLDLHYCSDITDRSMEALVTLKSSLTSLNVRGCPITDIGVQHIGELTRLKVLDISKCSSEQTLLITDLGVSFLDGLKRLKHIELAWNKCITDDSIRILTSRGQRLTTINLQCCVGLTNATCQLLASQPLESFDVLGCSMITDIGLDYLLSSPSIKSTLSRLSLAYCLGITDTTVDAILDLGKKLEWIDLRDCLHITTQAKTKLLKRFAHAQVGCS